MRQSISGTLDRLLDESGCLGVGVADASGLVIDHQGGHDGRDPVRLAAELAGAKLAGIERSLDDALDERILVGAAYTLLCRWFLERRYLVWALAASAERGGPVRTRLREASERLERLFAGRNLLAPEGKGLEKPRKFSGEGLLR